MSTPDLEFYPLTFLDEGDAVTVGRTDTDSYCVLPADGAFLLRRLTEGAPQQQAAREYSERYGETVDLDDFLDAMGELGFIKDGDDGDGPPEQLRGRRLGEVLFSRPAGLLYAVVFAVAAVQTARHPDLIPHYRDLFFTDFFTVVLTVLFLGQIPFLLLHESFHMLAGRRLGLRSQLGIGRRLWFVVAETTMDGLVTAPRRKRYVPILAGMLADLLSVALLLLAASFLRNPDGSQPLAGRVCLAFAFYNLLRVAWQFFFYLRTDLYYLVVTVFGCLDLHDSSMLILRNHFHRLTGRRHRIADEEAVHPRDRRVAHWYCWLVVVGYSFSFAVLLTTGLPAAIHVLSTIAGHLTDQSASDTEYADAIVFLAVNALQAAILAYVLVRDRRRTSAAQPAPLLRSPA